MNYHELRKASMIKAEDIPHAPVLHPFLVKLEQQHSLQQHGEAGCNQSVCRIPSLWVNLYFNIKFIASLMSSCVENNSEGSYRRFLHGKTKLQLLCQSKTPKNTSTIKKHTFFHNWIKLQYNYRFLEMQDIHKI